MGSPARMFAVFYRRLLRAHPAERGGDLWFQEEARAERLSNFIRIVYVLAWLIATTLHAPGNYFWANFSNLGVGGLWFVWALCVQTWLWHHPYRLQYKFVTTAVDMFIVTLMIWFCQFAGGPSFALKVPTFLNYFCCVGLASLRFKRGLAVFGGSLAMALYLSMWIYFQNHYHLVYGTNFEHTSTAKVNWHYLVFQLVYLGIFSFLTYVAAVNVRRLVELRARENEAALKAREHSRLAAGVAHEIKNPLEGIYGAAQLLRDEGRGSARFIEMILKDATRLNDVVQQFLQFSRPLAVRMQFLDLAAAADDFCQAQTELNPSAPVEFLSELRTFKVQSDPEAIRQILLNLIQNARRFQVEGRPVRVKLRAHDEAVELQVDDDGPGVPEEQRIKLFEPFYTTSAKGTGLGLAISRKIARELGGDLYYEPLQPGSRFTLVLKIHPGEEAA